MALDKRGKLRVWVVRECAIIGTHRRFRSFLLASTTKSFVPGLLQPGLLEVEFGEASMPSTIENFVPGLLELGFHAYEFRKAPILSTFKSFVPRYLQPGLHDHGLS